MANEPQSETGGRSTDASSSADPPNAVENRGHEINDRIRERAYRIWIDEGKPDGRALDHWLRARWEIEGEAKPD